MMSNFALLYFYDSRSHLLCAAGLSRDLARHEFDACCSLGRRQFLDEAEAMPYDADYFHLVSVRDSHILPTKYDRLRLYAGDWKERFLPTLLTARRRILRIRRRR